MSKKDEGSVQTHPDELPDRETIARVVADHAKPVLDAAKAAAPALDVPKVRAEAESWLSTYPRADGLPSNDWAWLNGRCHPRIVLALCERIAELETRLDITGQHSRPDPVSAVDGGWGGQ